MCEVIRLGTQRLATRLWSDVLIRLTCVVTLLTVAVVACGGDASTDEPIFGTEDTTCTSVRLQNDVADAELVDQASDCLVVEIEAGRPVTVDIAAITVEGDPIYIRYAFDGAQILIVEDNRADQFGSGGVSARRCLGITSTRHLPEGVDCSPADHAGFPEATN